MLAGTVLQQKRFRLSRTDHQRNTRWSDKEAIGARPTPLFARAAVRNYAAR